MNYSEVSSIIKDECKKHGVRFYQGRGKTVKYLGGQRSNGYFSFDLETKDAVLAVATNENSMGVLIHEYCHMEQWLEQTPEWKAIERNTVMWEWLGSDDEYDPDDVEESVAAFYTIERDCERRAVEYHIKWNTGQNIEEYIQKSNAYTLFYFFMLETRRWYVPGREPYSLESVWRAMPKTFDFNIELVYHNVRKLYEQCI